MTSPARIAFVATLIAAVSVANQVTSAKEQLQQLQTALHEAHLRSDWPAYLKNSRILKDFMNRAPDSVLQLMSAEAFAGNVDGALSECKEYVRMGQANEDVLKLKQFDTVRADPRFAPIHKEMAANLTSISTASKAFSLSDSTLLPEDIDYDPATKRFYISSVLKKEILTSDLQGNTHLFAEAPDHWPMMALKIDREHRILWATEVALDGFTIVDQKDWGRSAILIYDLKSGQLLHRIEGPLHTALGDMTLTQDGDAILSDGDGGGVYRIRRETQQIERLYAGDFISPQTGAMLPDGKRIFVPDYARGIGILDLSTKQVTWVPMQGRYALNGIDGLYLDDHTLIATQNGTSPERVVAFKLDNSLTHILSERIIERATPTLGDPTHGVVVGDTFYYIANSGWDTLDEHGNRKPGTTSTSPLIMRARAVLDGIGK
jgi:sugar lactone lactonase YvrE